MMKKIIAILLLSVLLLPLFCVGAFSAEKDIDFSELGFQIGPNGRVLLGGDEYYGYGVNFFPAVSIALDREFGIYPSPDPEIYIKALADNGIPYFRCMFGVYYGKDVNLYAENKDVYFRALDRIILLCEKYRVGIIPSLFWNFYTFADWCGEKYDKIMDENSDTVKLQKQYIADVVGRYKYSPAVFAWEIGNEMNLQCEIMSYTASDGLTKKLTTDMLTRYYTILGNAIREADPYRMITGGDAQPRQNAMKLITGKGGNNTYDDIKSLFGMYTPSPLDAISVHYPILSLTDDYINAARELGIGLYVGECFSEAEYVHQSENESERKAGWLNTLDTYRNLGVQIMTYWCYGSYSQAKAIDIDSVELGIEDGYEHNVFVAESLKEINERFKSEGKNNIDDYWLNAGYAFYTGESGGVELAGMPAGGENWDLIDGVWSGTLHNNNGIIEPAVRKNDDGVLLIKSESTNQTVADVWLGNYIGIDGYIRPETEYKVTLTVKFDCNSSHPLHKSYPGSYSSVVFDVLSYGKSSLAEASITGSGCLIGDTGGDYKTCTLDFVSPTDTRDVMIQVGPSGAGGNYYWGGFAPGASIEIVSCLLEEKNPQNGNISYASGKAGESFSYLFYAENCGSAENCMMKFTVNGKENTVPGIAEGEFVVFTLDGITPQAVGDSITAELYVRSGGSYTKTDSLETSFADYLKKAVQTYPDDGDLKTLCADIFIYCAEAQKYTMYKTDRLCTADVDFLDCATVFDANEAERNSDRSSAGSDIRSAYLILYDYNRICFVINSGEYSQITLKKNGVEVGYSEETDGNITYIYSPWIKATENGSVFTLSVTRGSSTCTASYSVNAYVKSMYENPIVGDLVRSLYNYGVSALKY